MSDSVTALIVIVLLIIALPFLFGAIVDFLAPDEDDDEPMQMDLDAVDEDLLRLHREFSDDGDVGR